MKKYFLIVFILVFSLIIIIFYVMKNITMNKEIKNYTEIQQISYELEILNQKQMILVNRLDAQLNYEEIININKQFQNQLTYYSISIEKIEDVRLQKLLKQLKVKNKALLKINNLTSQIDKIILHTLRKLNKLHYQTTKIMQVLFLSTIFLVIFGFIIYIKEVFTSLEAQKLKNELQQFFDALNESAIVSKTDLKGVITYVNDKFTEISEYSKEELVGQAHNIVRHSDMEAEIFKNLWVSIEKKQVFKGTIKNRKKSGSYYFVDTSVMPIFDIHGNIQEYLAVRYDVTELVNARDMAISAEQAKDEFLSNMSHELRTPLNAINGFSAILKRNIKDAKQLSYLQNIIDSSQNLIGLINDILDLSKLQNGKFSLDYYDFNLRENIKLLLGRFDSLLGDAELTLLSKFDNLDIDLHGDWLRISQILTNLISNAIKFSIKGKSIKCIIKYENSELIMQVVDRGIGMNLQTQEKVFKPFEQADTSITREYGGTGLGLSIVASLVNQMKGTIKLQSQEGLGSTFTVNIPLEKAKVKELKNQEIEDLEIEKLCGHILIAEDNKTNQMLIGILVEEFGLTYKMANDGVEAVAMFGDEKFDLVLMDENMPNLNGCEAMRKIHSLHGKDVPIVALTANAMIGDKEKFLELGMDGYVSKPIDDEELHSVIKELLKNKIC